MYVNVAIAFCVQKLVSIVLHSIWNADSFKEYMYESITWMDL